MFNPWIDGEFTRLKRDFNQCYSRNIKLLINISLGRREYKSGWLNNIGDLYSLTIKKAGEEE